MILDLLYLKRVPRPDPGDDDDDNIGDPSGGK
jgi:hypothetical protein